MSKIMSKSLPVIGASAPTAAAAKAQSNSGDVLFSQLFGGAAGDTLNGYGGIDAAAMAAALTAVSGDQDEVESQPQDELLAMIAALQAGRGFGQKSSDQLASKTEEDAALGQGMADAEDQNPDSLAALMVVCPLVTPKQTGAANRGLAEGDRFETVQTKMESMAFEETGLKKNLGATGAGNKAASGVDGGQLPSGQMMPRNLISGQNKAPKSLMPGNLISGQNKAPVNATANAGLSPGVKPAEDTALAVTRQAVSPETFIGPIPENSAAAKIAANIANLKAIRAANLEQRNAEIEAQLFGDDNGEMIGKSDKQIANGASLKQAIRADNQLPSVDKGQYRAASGQNTAESARSPQGVSAAADSLLGGSNQSSNGQAGGQSNGQAGGQSNGQSSAASGGGLLNDLNMLQTLDMAKANWREMLLQRVQKGLAGGKDQLDFQLNPRNLGKMQISLVMQNDRTNIQIQTETSAAAAMLSDAEGRLAQMLEASGLRLGNLISAQSQGFGGNSFGGQADRQNQPQVMANADTGNAEKDGMSNAEITIERSENLINIQA
jgi:flagellar hook-length control protein FliK